MPLSLTSRYTGACSTAVASLRAIIFGVLALEADLCGAEGVTLAARCRPCVQSRG